MRVARIEVGGERRTAIVDDGKATEVALPWLDALAALAAGDTGVLEERAGRVHALDDVRLLAPLEDGAEVHCVGLNYLEHRDEARELVDALPTDPIIFLKTARAVCGPADDLVLGPDVSVEFDWEVELGVVIGKAGRHIEPADAWDHVAGWTVVNDITARDLQRRHAQWHLAKNTPRATPVGPWVVARDDLDLPPDLAIWLTVDGVEKQRARTSELLFDIPTLVATLSHAYELRAGDVIATGTPSGVGFKRNPPEFLVDGNLVEAAVDGIGSLVNRVRARP